MAPAADSAIHTEGLSKTYGAVRALSDLTMTVPRGEIFGFLGPNGAGKTTAVKLLTGLSRPTSGRAWVLGEPAGDTAARGNIGYLPELFRYQMWLSAFEVLALHCELAGVATGRRSSEIEEALVTVGLAGRARDRISTFSKGMQQRLGLAVALLGRPELVFLDEPTSALDPVGRKEVRDVIRGLKDRGSTVFLNSHLLSEVEQICDRVAVVESGRVLASGMMSELLGSSTVHVRVTDWPADGLTAVGSYGRVELFGEDLIVDGIDPSRVPELVEYIVMAGVRVHSVQRVQQTLEEKFVELLGGRR